MDILFSLVWKDIYIRSVISKHLKLYIHKQIIFQNCEELNQFDKKDYLLNVKIINDLYDQLDIPYGIEILEFGELCEREIYPGYLPNSIKHLKFGKEYDYPIKPNTIPHSLKVLEFGYKWNNKLNGECGLPIGLEVIKFGYCFDTIIKCGDLKFTSLKEVHFGYCFSKELEIGSIPSTVEKLIIGYKYNHPILEPGIIPLNCKSLEIRGDFNHPLIEGVLPIGIIEVHLGLKWDQNLLPNHLPNTIQKLSFGLNYNNGGIQLVPGSIPMNCKSLLFGRCFNLQIKPNILPYGLLELSFGDEFDKQILPGSIPSSVTSLSFGSSFKNNGKKLDFLIIPNSVIKLNFNCSQFPQLKQSDYNKLNANCFVYVKELVIDEEDFGISFRLFLCGIHLVALIGLGIKDVSTSIINRFR